MIKILKVLVLGLVSAAACFEYSYVYSYEPREPIANVYAVTTTGESITSSSFEEFVAKIHKLLCPSTLHYIFSGYPFSSVKNDLNAALTMGSNDEMVNENLHDGFKKFESTMERYHKTFCNSVPRIKRYSRGEFREFLVRIANLEERHYENYSKITHVPKDREAYLWIHPQDAEYVDPGIPEPVTRHGFVNSDMRYYYMLSPYTAKPDEFYFYDDDGQRKFDIVTTSNERKARRRLCAEIYYYNSKVVSYEQPIDDIIRDVKKNVPWAPMECVLYMTWKPGDYDPPLSRRVHHARSLGHQDASDTGNNKVPDNSFASKMADNSFASKMASGNFASDMADDTESNMTSNTKSRNSINGYFDSSIASSIANEMSKEPPSKGKVRFLRSDRLILRQDDNDDDTNNGDTDKNDADNNQDSEEDNQENSSVVGSYGFFTSFQIMVISVLIPIGITFYISMKAAFSM